MRADRVEISWDAGKRKWLVRIESGDEVIRRLSDLPKEADDEKLRSAAQQTAQEEGYAADLAQVSVRR